MQADIKSAESEILSSMLSGQLESEVSLTNYQAIVIAAMVHVMEKLGIIFGMNLMKTMNIQQIIFSSLNMLKVQVIISI